MYWRDAMFFEETGIPELVALCLVGLGFVFALLPRRSPAVTTSEVVLTQPDGTHMVLGPGERLTDDDAQRISADKQRRRHRSILYDVVRDETGAVSPGATVGVAWLALVAWILVALTVADALDELGLNEPGLEDARGFPTAFVITGATFVGVAAFDVLAPLRTATTARRFASAAATHVTIGVTLLVIAMVEYLAADGRDFPVLPAVVPALAGLSAAIHVGAWLAGRPRPRVDVASRSEQALLVLGRHLLRDASGAVRAPTIIVGGQPAVPGHVDSRSDVDEIFAEVPSGVPKNAETVVRRADGVVASMPKDAGSREDEAEGARGGPAAARADAPEADGGDEGSGGGDRGGEGRGGGDRGDGRRGRADDQPLPGGVPWDLLLQLVGAGAALAGWVAVVGGAQVWARLDAADVDSAETLAALPDRLYLVEGLQALLVPLLVGALVALFVYYSRRPDDPTPVVYERHPADEDRKRVRRRRTLEPIRAVQHMASEYGRIALALTVLIVVLLVVVTFVVVGVSWIAVVTPLFVGLLLATTALLRGHPRAAAAILGAGLVVAVIVPVWLEVTAGHVIAIGLTTLGAVWLTLGAMARGSKAARVAWILFVSVALWAGALGFVQERGARDPELQLVDARMTDGTAVTGLLLGRTDKEILLAQRRTEDNEENEVLVLHAEDVASLTYGPGISADELRPILERREENAKDKPGNSGAKKTPTQGPNSLSGPGITPKAADQREEAIASDEATIEGSRLRLDVVSVSRAGRLLVVNLRLINLEKDGEPVTIGATFGDPRDDTAAREDSLDGISDRGRRASPALFRCA